MSNEEKQDAPAESVETNAGKDALRRRDILKIGLIAGAGSAGYLISNKGFGRAASTGSPRTRPFVDPLPIPPIKTPVPYLYPAPQEYPLPGEGRRRSHQAFKRFPPQKYYEIHQRAGKHRFHSDLPLTDIWGFDGIVPGPTYHARYGEPILVRNFNDLPQNHTGFGIPQVTTHLHNAHTPSESDGFPTDFFPFQVGGSELFYDQHYPNVCAGFSKQQYAPYGDIRESLSTLWYHDHRVDFTSQNVYRGLAGFYLLFNGYDTGNEATGFRLPSGKFDVPMLFADKIFDKRGRLVFDLFNQDGILGDKFTVNGKIQPHFKVHPRRYRLRWLNAGPSRFYQLFLTNPADPSIIIPFTRISSDGNLLPQSLTVTNLRLAVAQRADVIVDFSQHAGKSIILENRLEQLDGRGPTDEILPAGQGHAILRFDVQLPDVGDGSQAPPYTFYDVPRPSKEELAAARVRYFRLERGNGQWQINGEFFDGDKTMADPVEGTSEIWVLQNNSGGWQHPAHIHFEEFQMLSRNGQAPPPHERGRMDVADVRHNEEIRLFLRFRDFVGHHVMHCHNTLHEDHSMMLRWEILPA
ncbi:MAG: multicopper oxidase domain-containing protein [Polyangiaceae bacterium]|nr:multicopper oxidase domain-containing protein [Polyangiaceae bacterium]